MTSHYYDGPLAALVVFIVAMLAIGGYGYWAERKESRAFWKDHEDR